MLFNVVAWDYPGDMTMLDSRRGQKQVASQKHKVATYCSLLVFIVATMATASVLASIEANNAACGHCQPRVCS